MLRQIETGGFSLFVHPHADDHFGQQNQRNG